MQAELLFRDKTVDFMAENLHPHTARPPWGVHPMQDTMNPAPHKCPVGRNLKRALDRGLDSS